uniref:Uncharacterized protein n=1 Tax=Rhizophora mucronata TaxID=61149 RepID=A0A2P2PK08_RHIMU
MKQRHGRVKAKQSYNIIIFKFKSQKNRLPNSRPNSLPKSRTHTKPNK